MKLKKLKNLICSDLQIIDHSCNKHYTMVNCHGEIFECLEEKEVIGIRAYNDMLVVSVK